MFNFIHWLLVSMIEDEGKRFLKYSLLFFVIIAALVIACNCIFKSGFITSDTQISVLNKPL